MEKKILVIEVNWIGDVLFTTPFIRAIRKYYGGSYIAALIHPRCAEMLEGNPRLNEIIFYDEDGKHRGFLGKLKLIAYLRGKHFDTIFLLHRSYTKAIIAFMAGAKDIIGYPTKNRRIFLTRAVEEPTEEIHKVEYFLNLAKAAGVQPREIAYEFFLSGPDREFAKEFLRHNNVSTSDRLVVICPGGNWEPKRWPKENFARLADILIEKSGAKVIIAGAAKDIRLAEDVKGLMSNKAISACGRTTLKQLAALFEKAFLVVANDTGPMHIAVASGAKVIALFGPTSSAITGPYGKGNYKVISRNETCEVPCYDVTCMDNRCMADIKVEDVLAEIKW